MKNAILLLALVVFTVLSCRATSTGTNSGEPELPKKMPEYLGTYFSYLDTKDGYAEETDEDKGITGMIDRASGIAYGKGYKAGENVTASYINSDNEGIVSLYERTMAGGTKVLERTISYVFPQGADFPVSYSLLIEGDAEPILKLDLSGYDDKTYTFTAVDAKLAELIQQGGGEPADLWEHGETMTYTGAPFTPDHIELLDMIKNDEGLTSDQKVRLCNFAMGLWVQGIIGIRDIPM
jgi:hypothetical protein